MTSGFHLKNDIYKSDYSKLNVTYYKIDNVVWMMNKNGDIRSVEKSDEYLNQILIIEVWIINGLYYEWVFKVFRKQI